MNWKRGLFRAWLLVTGLWLALNVAFFRPDVGVQTYWKLREVEAVGAQPSAPAARRQHRSIPDMLALSDEEQLLERKKQFGLRAKKNLKFFALTAFLPPAILFVIGAGGLWVFSGFRRGDT